MLQKHKGGSINDYQRLSMRIIDYQGLSLVVIDYLDYLQIAVILISLKPTIGVSFLREKVKYSLADFLPLSPFAEIC